MQSFNQYRISIYSSYVLFLSTSSVTLFSPFYFLLFLSTLCSNLLVATSTNLLSLWLLAAHTIYFLYYFCVVWVLSDSGLPLLFIISSFCNLLSFCFLLESTFFPQSASPFLSFWFNSFLDCFIIVTNCYPPNVCLV